MNLISSALCLQFSDLFPYISPWCAYLSPGTSWSHTKICVERFEIFTAVKVYPEHGGSMDLRNVGVLPQRYMASQVDLGGIGSEGMDYIELSQDRVKWRALENMTFKFQPPYKREIS
jgi:hypothetical protein